MTVGKGNAGVVPQASEGIFGDIHQVASTFNVGASAQIPSCPNGCKTGKVYRDGLRYNSDVSTTQRWLCTCCGSRFSNSPLKTSQRKDTAAKYALENGVKNFPLLKCKHLGTRELTDEERATITLFESYLKTEGYSGYSCYGQLIGTLLHLEANLADPEDVKAVIGKHKVKDGAKVQFCYAYEAYMAMRNKFDKTQKMTWDRPKYRQEEIIPFIPEESELDQLIAATSSKQLSAYLRTLKETFADPGEARRIEWKDIAGNIIHINHPVKNHRPRSLEVSQQLIAILNMLPHVSPRIFTSSYNSLLNTYVCVRKRLALKTKNDRLNYIEFRSFRHWGGTRIAELSNGNVLTVMKLLGHRSILNSMKYINIWKLSFKVETEYEYLSVTTAEELKAALVGGYAHVIDKFGASWFRRPKRIAIAGMPVNQRENM